MHFRAGEHHGSTTNAWRGRPRARQRQNREDRLLAEPVTGFVATSVADVVATVMAANEESEGAVDAQRFSPTKAAAPRRSRPCSSTSRVTTRRRTSTPAGAALSALA